MIAVTLRFCESVLIAIATGTADMGCIALTGATGSSHHSAVTMAVGRNGLGVAILTVFAGIGNNTIGGTTGRGRNLGSVAMTDCVGIVVLVAVSAGCTSIGCVTLCGTGGSGYGRGIAMSQSGDGLRIAVITTATSIGPNTVAGAGCFGRNL